MGRPRSFDEEQVIDLVLEAFWDRGYGGTSMTDLMTATGLHKASLYNAFGDKERLYFLALDRYLEGIETGLADLFSDQPGAGGIESWLQALLDMCRGNSGKRGCFAANAVAERANRDPQVKKVVSGHEQRLRKTIKEAIAVGQSDGAVTVAASAQDLTDFLWTFATGLRIAARGGEPLRALEPRIETVRKLLFTA